MQTDRDPWSDAAERHATLAEQHDTDAMLAGIEYLATGTDPDPHEDPRGQWTPTHEDIERLERALAQAEAREALRAIRARKSGGAT